MVIGPRNILFLLVLVIPISLNDAFFFDNFICKIGFLRFLLNLFFNICGETKNPSPTPPPRTYNLDDFKGISNAYSMEKGIIKVDWDESFIEELSELEFNIFVALGIYNFSFVLETGSVQDLIDIFTNEPTYQYISKIDINTISIETPFLGQEHSLIVIAQESGDYSSNSRSKVVVAARSDPHIRDEINVVGVFFPTKRLEIRLADVPEETEHTLAFAGPVAIEATNLMVGDVVTGFTSKFDPFVRRILKIVENTPNSVILQVISIRIDEVFDELDLDSSFEVSRTANVQGRRRRLFLGGWFNDNIVQPVNDKVIKPIGDGLTKVGETIADIVDDGQFDESFKFSFVDVQEEWDFQVTALPQPGDPTIASLSVKGQANVDVSLNANIRVTIIAPTYAYVGINAEYSIGATLSYSVGQKQEYEKTIPIWKGEKYSKVVFVGPIPVELYAQPSLAFEVKASASLTVGTEVGFSSRGGTSIGVVYDAGANPIGRPELVPPFNDFDRTLPTLEGTGTLEAGAGLVLSIEAGLYRGLLSASIGLRGGVDAKLAGGVTVIGRDVIPTVNEFEVSLGFNIPLSAKFLYGAFEVAPGSPLWEKKWPIITLPMVDIELLDDHRCILGSNGAASVASLSLSAEPSYPDGVFVGNPVVGSTDWYITSTDGWLLDKKEATEVSLMKTGLGLLSAQPDATVTIAIQARFPPLLKIVATVSLNSLFPSDAIPCTGPGPCDGEPFFDELVRIIGDEFNTKIFLSQPPDPSKPLVPSTVYKFEDFVEALNKLQNAGTNFQFWLGDNCSIASQKAAMVNLAAFLGQAMRETIIFDACDENNWDLWRANIFKEPTSPPENLPALYPMSSGCGQLGQKYADVSVFVREQSAKCKQCFVSDLRISPI
jgi:hypothetical protein